MAQNADGTVYMTYYDAPTMTNFIWDGVAPVIETNKVSGDEVVTDKIEIPDWLSTAMVLETPVVFGAFGLICRNWVYEQGRKPNDGTVKIYRPCLRCGQQVYDDRVLAEYVMGEALIDLNPTHLCTPDTREPGTIAMVPHDSAGVTNQFGFSK